MSITVDRAFLANTPIYLYKISTETSVVNQIPIDITNRHTDKKNDQIHFTAAGWARVTLQ